MALPEARLSGPLPPPPATFRPAFAERFMQELRDMSPDAFDHIEDPAAAAVSSPSRTRRQIPKCCTLRTILAVIPSAFTVGIVIWLLLPAKPHNNDSGAQTARMLGGTVADTSTATTEQETRTTTTTVTSTLGYAKTVTFSARLVYSPTSTATTAGAGLGMEGAGIVE